MSNLPNPQFGDKEILTDLLTSEKALAGLYNTFAIESANPAMHAVQMNLLNDQHQVQQQIFAEMQSRGWYPTEAAQQQKITETKMKFQQN